MKTRGLCHMAINVADMDRSIRFYTDMFEMEVLRRTRDMAFLHTPGSQDNLALFRAAGPVRPSGMAHFGFAVDEVNLNRAMDYIRSNKIKTMTDQATITDRFIYVLDPDGYVIQISTV